MLTLYRLFLYLGLPFFLARLGWRALRNRRYAERWLERFAWSRQTFAQDGIWLHAVSVGEVNAAAALVMHLREQYPQREITVTTMTPTGAARAQKLFASGVRHCYLPYDYPGAVARFLRRIRPEIALVMETEIWPNLIHACNARGIPMVYVNVRMSMRSQRGYQKFSGLIKPTLQKVARFAVQSEADAQRLMQLGARADAVCVTGSIKFDVALPPSLLEAAQAVRRMLGAERAVWVAGSTHEGEEETVIDAFLEARKKHPQLLLVLVPRHPERFGAVLRLCQSRGCAVVRRSEMPGALPPQTDVYLGDTMGELPLLIAAGDIAFIGGSLIPVGGHNLLEACAVGVPVVFGMHMFNFAKIAELVLHHGAGVQIMRADELAGVVVRWLDDASLGDEYGCRGRELVEQNKGALDEVAALIAEELPQW